MSTSHNLSPSFLVITIDSEIDAPSLSNQIPDWKWKHIPSSNIIVSPTLRINKILTEDLGFLFLLSFLIFYLTNFPRYF